MNDSKKVYDLIIIGAGPAGLTAAIYAARGMLSTLVVDQSSAGGQVKTTHQVANFPGFVEPIPGYQLAGAMRKQAERYGARFELAAEITGLRMEGELKEVEIDGVLYQAHHLILATGSSPRNLHIPGEQEYKGSGISYCATCDGDFYKDQDVVVVGGGNSAMEESLLLLQYVRSLTVIHQFDTLQAEGVTAQKILGDPRVKVLWSHEPRAFIKEGERMCVTTENLQTHAMENVDCDGVFIFVGMSPSTELFHGRNLSLSEQGYIHTDERMQTGIPGVYAVGDVRVKKFRQITTAVSDGTIAAMEVIQSRRV